MKNVHKDQRGIGHAVLAVLIVVVVAAVGFAGYRVMQNNKKPAAAKTTAGKAVNSACLKVYNDQNLCNAAAVSTDFSKLAYTAVDTSVDASTGQTSKITLQSDGKGNTAFTTGSGSQSYSTVEIGSTVYTKLAGATSWTKYSSSAAPSTPNPSSDIKTEFSDTSTPAAKRIQYKSLGKEKCGNLTCYKYQVIDPATPGTTNYVWFDTKDYRLQRWYGKDAQGTNDFVITYGSVTIKVPSPVVDASAPAATGAPSQAQIQAAEQAAAAAAAQAGH